MQQLPSFIQPRLPPRRNPFAEAAFPLAPLHRQRGLQAFNLLAMDVNGTNSFVQVELNCYLHLSLRQNDLSLRRAHSEVSLPFIAS